MAGVNEFIVDGVSGLAPSSTPSCMIVGTCSSGEVGKAYLLGKDSDLSVLGVGPLVDRLKDLFATGGQSPSVIAVPVAGAKAGYTTEIKHTGTGPDAALSGAPTKNVDCVVEIVSSGDRGSATYRKSVYLGGEIIVDGGLTWGSADTLDASGQIGVDTTGLILTLPDGLVAGDTYAFSARLPIGMVYHEGTGPDITPSGDVSASAQVVLKMLSDGLPNIATYSLSLDGGDTFGTEQTVPLSGSIPVGSTGVTIGVSPSTPMKNGDKYFFDLYAPEPTITDVMTKIDSVLDIYDVEFVYVVGPSDSVGWAAMGAKADELWNKHRPTFFLAESRLPNAGEDLNDWVTAMIAERQSYTHRFVLVCTPFGEVSSASGTRQKRNFGGLLAGKILSIAVNTAIGKVALGAISQASLPNAYSEAHQQQLESAGLITAKRYSGLNGVYWGDDRTLADVTSDYQFLVVLRTTFKAIRIARIAALKHVFSEAGDPEAEGGASGVDALKAEIEVALEQMTKAIPPELAAFVVNIPDGQDIVNNGVSVELNLVGIPIIKNIRLYAKYTYAGSSFDARLEG